MIILDALADINRAIIPGPVNRTCVMTTENASLPKCPLWRRLAAALYDALLLFGVLGVARSAKWTNSA